MSLRALGSAARSIPRSLGLDSAAGLEPSTAGWATRSLTDAAARSAMRAAAAWQAVMIPATLATLGVAGTPLALAQAIIGALALAGDRLRVPPPLVPLSMAAAALWGYLASGDLGSTLAFAACWQINFCSAAAAMLVLRRWVVAQVVGTATAIAVTLLVALPAWGPQFPLVVILTQTSIVCAIRFGLGALLDQARRTDRARETAEQEAREAELRKGESIRAAEAARVLHDTAINTLSAIANGRATTLDPDEVRAQCAHDVAHLDALRGVDAAIGAPAVRVSDVFRQRGIRIARSGLDDKEADRLDLPASLTTAIVGCVREAVTNAAKHSFADHVEIDLAVTADVLIVRIRDAGIGFAPEQARLRGIDSSIATRATDHGFTADVRSAPGEGTTVTLEIPLDPQRREGAVAEGTRPQPEAVARAAQQRSGDFWGLGVTVVSVILTVAGGADHDGALLPMIGLMALAAGASRIRAVNRHPYALGAFLVLATLAVFFLSAQATAFGTVGVAHWQALAPTGAFIILISRTSTRRLGVFGAAAWVALIVGMVAVAASSDVTAAQITAVAGCVGLGFSAVWVSFQTLVTRLTVAGAAERRQALRRLIRAELDLSAESEHRRWQEAGLDSATMLLQEIADRRRDPGSPETRAACAAEEEYLRQLTQLGAELALLRRELPAVLRRARHRGVHLRLRIGSADAPDETSARDIAALLGENVENARGGSTITATLFPVRGVLHVTLTGERLRAGATNRDVTPETLPGSLQLIQMQYAVPATSGSVGTGGARGESTSLRLSE